MKVVEKSRKESKTRKRSLHPCAELLAQFIGHSYRGLPSNIIMTREELIQDCSDMFYFRFGGFPPTLIEDMVGKLYDIIQSTEYLLSKPIYKHLSDAERLILGKPFEKELELARFAIKKGLSTANVRDDIVKIARKE